MQHKRLRNVVDDDGGVGPAKQVYSLTCAFAHPSAHSRHPSIQPASHLERLCNTGEAMQRKHKRQRTAASGEQVHSFINALGGWVGGWMGGWVDGWVGGWFILCCNAGCVCRSEVIDSHVLLCSMVEMSFLSKS